MRAAAHRNVGLNGGLERKTLFKEQRLKRQHGILRERAQIERGKNLLYCAIIYSCKL